MGSLVGNRIDTYLIIEKLGEGGMAEVYKAYETTLERFVALKIIRPEIFEDPDFIPRFESEAKMLARFNHPNIVRIYGFGYEDKRPYLVTEYVSGGTLKDWLEEKDRLSVEEALPILSEVSSALDAAHSQNIIHRDVKPANIMLTEDGRALLSDFGISKLVDTREAAEGSTQIGTLDYMAPEQISPDQGIIGPASDIYALGMVLYEMICGRLPFSGDTPADKLIHRIHDPPKPPREIIPELSKDVELVILKALSSDPADRFNNASAVVKALEAAVEVDTPRAVITSTMWWVSDEEISPEPGEPPYRGLHHFDVEDAGLFFGREVLTAFLVKRIQKEGFLAVVGASGSGKSSVVRAGVVPTLVEEDHWDVHIITPGTHPIESLALSLTREIESLTAAETLINDLKNSQKSLDLFIKRQIKQRENEKLLLVIDQFEEVFTSCKDESERKMFIDNVVTATAEETDGMVSVIITLRADFYDRCFSYDKLLEELEQHQANIGAMTTAELRSAIVEPARVGHWEIEPGLVEMLVNDVGAGENRKPEPGALPLLSHALLETWERRRGRSMMLNGYISAGGVKGAIARTAEGIFTDLEPAQQTIARDIFLRLTELGEGGQDTRRRVHMDELVSSEEERKSVEDVLKLLTDARLVTTSKDTVEVAHEALIREWPTLREWLEEDREALRIHRYLTEAALEWDRRGRDMDGLYRGTRLSQAETWSEEFGTEMNALEIEFLHASQQAVVRQRRARRLRGAAVVGALAVAVVAIMLGLTGKLNRFIYQPVDMEDYWIEIPAGGFMMGSEESYNDEVPAHSVYLDTYLIGKYEVTNQQYFQCIKADVCQSAGSSGNVDEPDHPVVEVSWYDAQRYCEWVGGRLPTEAEWEKAARGGLEGKLYPWGNDPPVCETGAQKGAQFNGCDVGTVSVGSFAPNGYGLYDMSGNVWEWVRDWFDSGYYQVSPEENPQGPASGTYRVMRGGSWYDYSETLWVANRDPGNPDSPYERLGIRCALSEQP